MSNPHPDFHPYDETRPGEYHPAQSSLFHRRRLRHEHEEDWPLNRDRDRAHEFADFFFGHPELQGCERALCADLVVESAIELIEPGPVDELEPAPDDVAEALIRRLLADKYTRYYLECYVSPEVRAGNYPLYRRIAALYDRVVTK